MVTAKRKARAPREPEPSTAANVPLAPSGPDLLAAWRKKRKLSQHDVGNALGLKGGLEIYRWEKGRSKPRLANAVKLEELTGISPACWNA